MLFSAVRGNAWKPSATFARVSSNAGSSSYNPPKISIPSPSTKIQTKILYVPTYTNYASSSRWIRDSYPAYGGYYLGRMLSRPYGCYTSCGNFDMNPYYNYIPYRDQFEYSYPSTTASPEQKREEERKSKIMEWRRRIAEMKQNLGEDLWKDLRESIIANVSSNNMS